MPKRPGADAGWRVLFAFLRPWRRAAQAGRYCSMDKSTFSLMVVLLSLGGGGCASHKPKVAPVAFTHPDETRIGEGFMVLADRRVFVTMAFLNATGFDNQPPGVAMHPVRQKVRKQTAETLAPHPEKLRKWRQYVKSKNLGDFTYQDFALSLQADYPFQRIRPDKELNYPFTAQLLADLPEVLRDFWITADLTNVWNEVKGDYQAELKKYDLAAMQRQMNFLWEYLRTPRQDTLTIVHVPNLLAAHHSAIGSDYETYYYCVEGPGSGDYSLQVHEYLHSIVNPMVKTNFPAYQAKLLRYYEAGKRGPLSKTYQDPVGFTSECLVRALDHRFIVQSHLNATDAAQIRAAQASQVANQTKQGLTLTRPFYELLPEYEASRLSFDAFLTAMLARLPDNPPGP